MTDFHSADMDRALPHGRHNQSLESSATFRSKPYSGPYSESMNIESVIESIAKVENAGGQYSLVFPYTSSIGTKTEHLTVHVPIHQEQPSANDKKALFEAVTVQGGLGRWVQKNDGSIWLVPTDAV